MPAWFTAYSACMVKVCSAAVKEHKKTQGNDRRQSGQNQKFVGANDMSLTALLDLWVTSRHQNTPVIQVELYADR